jgi:hypothetical protein
VILTKIEDYSIHVFKTGIKDPRRYFLLDGRRLETLKLNIRV